MRAEKAGRGPQPSTSLRTSEKSTTRPSGLSDSAKLMGTLEYRPDGAEEGVSVSMQVPGDGTADSLSVRPATKNAVQVFGSLSRVGKKLRDSQEAQANKRTQSQAGIDQEDGDTRGKSKRLRTSDTATSRGKSHVNPRLSPERNSERNPEAQSDGDPHSNPGDQPAPQPVAQPIAPPVAQAAVKPPVKPAARPTVQQAPQPPVQPAIQPVIPPAVQRAVLHSLQSAPRPVPQAATRVIPVPLAPAFDMTPEITPDMHAQIAMAEALRMANSILPYQPEKISELFQHLCRAQLWPLLKLEEQRAIYLMNLQRMMPVTYGATSIPDAGMAMAVDGLPSSTTTTTTSTPTRTPTPTPTTQPVPSAQTERTGQGSNASKISEVLLPDPPNPPSLYYAQRLLGPLPPGTKRLLEKSAEEIRKMLGWQKLDLATTNNMTALVCLLVEIVSHGGLPHLKDELDSIVHAFLQRYLTSHRHRENENKRKIGAESGKGRGGKDPAHAQLLRLLTQYPQFARVLGNSINDLQTTHRTHLGITRKFNAVLTLMKERRYLPEAQFKQRLDAIIDDALSPESSPTATPASTPASTASSTTSSTPTSARTFELEGGEDEGSDGEI